jgi:hypothetical protein
VAKKEAQSGFALIGTLYEPSRSSGSATIFRRFGNRPFIPMRSCAVRSNSLRSIFAKLSHHSDANLSSIDEFEVHDIVLPCAREHHDRTSRAAPMPPIQA